MLRSTRSSQLYIYIYIYTWVYSEIKLSRFNMNFTTELPTLSVVLEILDTLLKCLSVILERLEDWCFIPKILGIVLKTLPRKKHLQDGTQQRALPSRLQPAAAACKVEVDCVSRYFRPSVRPQRLKSCDRQPVSPTPPHQH